MKILKKGSRGPQVKLLQHWLNKIFLGQTILKESGKFDSETEAAVMLFKMTYGIRPFDGQADELTIAAVGTQLGSRADGGDAFGIVPMQLLNTFFGPLNIRKANFFENYAKQFGLPTEDELEGLSTLLTFVDLDPDIDDVRWAAYMLATVYHECAHRWRPINEFGKGRGHEYGNPVNVVGSDGLVHTNSYYGRGYVQLTWKQNYQNFDDLLHLGGRLVTTPDLALDPTIAYQIMSLGMREGAFRHRKGDKDVLGGHKLRDYILGTKRDYYNARNIINGGHDKADTIERHALILEAILRSSLY